MTKLVTWAQRRRGLRAARPQEDVPVEERRRLSDLWRRRHDRAGTAR